ncbi:MAG: mechanosensitive ion channel [Gemmatimonadetes bacterium]|nr:mechanosensitive ion channel [Gemmatimonadota bacterium]NIO31877.1 mechanosensitive ion channel [Gemmatimonadota bacterium]
MLRIGTSLALVVAVTLTAPPAARARPSPQTQTQGQAQGAADTAQAPRQPTAIAAAEIVVEAERASQELRRIRATVVADPAIEELQDRLPELSDIRDELADDPASQQPEDLSRRALQSVENEWTNYRGRLQRWQSTLSARAGALGRESQRLGQLRATWRVTSEAAAEQDYPETAVEVVRSVLASIDSVQAQLRSRLEIVLTLQNQVAELESEAGEVLARVAAAQEEARLGLLSPESLPIWRAIAAPQVAEMWAAVRESLREDVRGLLRFVDGAAGRLPVQGIVLLLVLAGVIGLRRRSKGWAAEDPELEASARVLDRPIAVTILVMVMTQRLFHPGAPLVVLDLGRLLALIPVLRLLPCLLHPALRRPVYVFAALWLVDQLLTSLPEGTLIQRLALLTMTGLALVGLVWFLRGPGPAAVEGQKRWARAGLRLARVGLVLFGAAIFANILGFVDLARLLTSGTLASVMIAAAMYAAVEVVQVMVRLMLRTETAQAVASVRRNTTLLIRRAVGVAQFAGIASWLGLTLERFDLFWPTYDVVVAVLQASLTVGTLSVSLEDVLAFVLAIWVAVLVSRFTRFVLDQDVYPRLALPRGVPGAVSKLSQYVIVGLGIFIAFAAAGIDLSSLALLAGALGVGIGFGLQAIINNFVSGLILIFERPIQVGDTIDLEGLRGSVTHIGIRASTVRTLEGAEVIVPNGDLITGRVTNWTLSDRLRRIEVAVGVAYGTDPHRVRELLLEVARAQPDCLDDPEPFVLFQGFGASSLDFSLRFWTANFENWFRIQSEATFAVHDALKEAGITIPFPQRDLHLKSIDAAIPGLASRGPRAKAEDDS